MPRAFLMKKDAHTVDLATMELAFPGKPDACKEYKHTGALPYFNSTSSPWSPVGIPTATMTFDHLAHQRQPLAPKNPESLWINSNVPPLSTVYLSIAHNSTHWSSPGCSTFTGYHPVTAYSHHFPNLLSPPLLKPKIMTTAFDIDTILGNGNLNKANFTTAEKAESMEVESEEGKLARKKSSRYQCAECRKSYSTMSGLTKHRDFHCTVLHQQSWKCSAKSCNRLYGTVGALKMHMRTHTLPNQCTVCGRRFSRPWLLQGHMRTHSGEKPFQCPQCMRPFADRSNLRAHLQTHADVKKYKCDVCMKTFSRMSLLNKHQSGSCRPDNNMTEGTLV